MDLNSLDSVREGAAKCKSMLQLTAAKTAKLHGIVCNAGAQFTGPVTYSADGYETTFAGNCLGHFLLMNLLLDSVAAGGRIVWTASGTHDPALMDGKSVGKAAEHYRQGYIAVTRRCRPQRGAPASNMLQGALRSAELPIQVRAMPVETASPAPSVPVEASGGERAVFLSGHPATYAIDLRVDPSAINFAQQGGREIAKVYYAVVAYDQSGHKVFNVASGAISANLDNDRFKSLLSDGLRARQVLELPPGPLILRIGVEEIQTGHTGSVEYAGVDRGLLSA